MQHRCELACSARLCYATMLTETSNSSVSAPQRDSPDVKAANKERQTIISMVSLLSCCCTEIGACMCKQITPEKVPHKQFKAVVGILRHNARGPTAGWTAICWVVTVFDCQEAGGASAWETERRRVWVWGCSYMLRLNTSPDFSYQ